MGTVMLGVSGKVLPNETRTFVVKSQAKGSFSSVQFRVSSAIAPFFSIVAVVVGSQNALEGESPGSAFEADAFNTELSVEWNAPSPIQVTVRNIDVNEHEFYGSIRADDNIAYDD